MFSNNTYAKLWKIEQVQGKNYYQGQISTSRKNQQGEYETDFSASFVRFVGNAAKTAASLKDGDRIHIINCGVTNSYDKEKKVTYTNYIIFECENASNGQQPQKKPDPSSFNDVSDAVDEELPFS